MTHTIMGSLREVQKLDERIREIGSATTLVDDRIAEVEEPALALESELSQLTGRLAQMNADVRGLERSADDKRARGEKMDQRLSRVSNLREEAAVMTELDLIRRAIEGDEYEALQLLDQIGRSEEAAAELGASAAAERSEVGRQREVLLAERQTFGDRLEAFSTRRVEILKHVGSVERRVYDSFHRAGRPTVVALLLEDGACGHCFGLIPLQLQNEIRRNDALIRCENCGVILTVEPEPVLDEEVLRPVELPTLNTELDDGTMADDPDAGESGSDSYEAGDDLPTAVADEDPKNVQAAESA